MILADGASPLPITDVCIVGAGPVGLALAFKLEELGCTVLVLESGPVDPEIGATEFLAGNHARPGAATHHGIGGTSALWGGRCVKLDDLDFEKRDHVANSGWPIPHSCLSRHYDAALVFLQASSAPVPPLAPEGAEDFVMDSAERWSRSPALAPVYEPKLASAASITLVTNAVVSEVVLDKENKRVYALRLMGRAELLTPGIVVLAAGGLETARLLLSLQKNNPDALGGTDGALGRFYQGHLTGYLAVVDLVDQDVARDLSFASDQQGGLHRRRLQPSQKHQMDEQLLNIVFWLDPISISDPAHGSGSLSLLYLLLKASGTYRRFSHGLAPRSGPRRQGEAWRHLRNISLRGASLAKMVRMLRRGWRRGGHGSLINPAARYLLRYHAEQAPNPDSRVQLGHADGSTTILQVDYRVEDRDILSVLRAHHLLDQWLRAKGYGKLEYLRPEDERFRSVLAQAFDGYHQIGLARMSDHPQSGVVDPDCRVHQIDNLYVAGASVFPTGGHANPTLPAVALALRLAEHLARVVKQKKDAVVPTVV
ncbi:MAG: GMC oxidoreductase [Pseudorhizobium sp.]